MVDEGACPLLWISTHADAGQLAAFAAAGLEVIPLASLSVAQGYVAQGHSTAGVLLDWPPVAPPEEAALSSLQHDSPLGPIIALVSSGQEALGLAAIEAGADDYLLKETMSVAGLTRALSCARARRQRLRLSPKSLGPSDRSAEPLAMGVQQQAAVAQLGIAALGTHQPGEILQQVTEQVVEVLGVEFCKILQLTDDGRHLTLVAGVGWRPGLVGKARVGVDRVSQAGFTLQSHSPVCVKDLSQETRFLASSLMREHGVVSGISVSIYVHGHPWGLLGAYSQRVHQFSAKDTHFIQSIATLIALALERMTTQQALEESNRQMHEAQRIAALGNWEYDFASDCLTWSEACFRVAGVATTNFTPSRQGYLQCVHPDDQAAVHQEVEQAIRDRAPLDFEHRWVCPDGEIRYLHQRAQIVHDQAGNPIRMVGTLQDITQQQRAEEKLERSQALLRVASHISRMGAWWVDLATLTMTWSEEMYDILEQPLDYVPSVEDAPQYYVPEDRDQIAAAFERCAQTGEGFDLQLRVVTAKGQSIWARTIGEAVRDSGGQIVRVQGAFQDISAQKMAEQKIRESEERFRLLSKATNDAIWDWDIVRDIAWRGEAYKTLFGYSDDETLTMNDWWRDRVHPEDRQSVLDCIQRTLDNGGGSWSQEYRFRCQDGHYAYVFDRGYVIRNAQGQPIRMIGGMLNLTEKKSLEAQLLQSQKMEAIGQLAGGVAHDFNNLLTVILGCSELLLTRVPKADPMRSLVVDIHTAGDRASDLTRQLLAFSRKQVLAPQIIDLNAIVSSLEKMLKRLIKEDIRLSSILDPDVPPIEVDPTQLEQVILNLVVNARDAMPQGGDLTLETGRVTIEHHESLGKLDCKPGTYAALTVSDTGHGITPEAKAHIFEPFFTTKPPGKGTGLGLATVFGIVKQSEGLIDVYSEVNEGTRFKLLFPGVSSSASLLPGAVSPPIKPGQETILLIEDEADVRQIAKLALERLGYQVLEASHGQAALQRLDQDGDAIDLIITDVVMPGMNGRELVEHLRQRANLTPVLYMSGYTDDAVVRHGVINATDAFLQKPFTPSSLARKVREVLDKSALGTQPQIE
jgi:two-component system cell cycle sensor histidine kinase/response regulator CckA